MAGPGRGSGWGLGLVPRPPPPPPARPRSSGHRASAPGPSPDTDLWDRGITIKPAMRTTQMVAQDDSRTNGRGHPHSNAPKTSTQALTWSFSHRCPQKYKHLKQTVTKRQNKNKKLNKEINKHEKLHHAVCDDTVNRSSAVGGISLRRLPRYHKAREPTLLIRVHMYLQDVPVQK